jgi:chromosome segregation ATPase
VIPEEDEARRKRTPQEEEHDTLAERRARRAWLGDAALLRRAEAAEASVRTLEAHLTDLRARQVESERAREHTAAQLAERELELRRVKQREHAEQQLRVEAEEIAVRARRGHRTERDRWQRRVEEAHAAAQYAEEQRDALAARLAKVNESCERLRRGVVALQGVTADLRATFELEYRTSQARIRELEGELERARADPPPPLEQRSEAEEAQRREEMAGALAAAVARLRTRAAPTPPELLAPEAPRSPESSAPEVPTSLEPPAPEAPASPPKLPAIATPAPPQEIPTVFVVPRLFVGAGRLRPLARRIAARLTEWAGSAQEPPRP